MLSLLWFPLRVYNWRGELLWYSRQSLFKYSYAFGGLLFTIFVGWKMPKAKVYKEFTNDGTKKFNRIAYPIIYFLMRYVAPVGIIAIWLSIYL